MIKARGVYDTMIRSRRIDYHFLSVGDLATNAKIGRDKYLGAKQTDSCR